MSAHLRTHRDYRVGIICALALEKAAVEAMLDEEHSRLKKIEYDVNDYTLGRIGVHNVAIACLPAGLLGNGPAAIVAKDMMRSFPIKFGLMVGIGGGVWSKKADIRLGDVVVSQPEVTHGGVVQWDLGKMEKGGVFRRTGALNKPPPGLLHALQSMKTEHFKRGNKLPESLLMMSRRNPFMAETFKYQGEERDQLFKADYDHEGDETCDECDIRKVVERKPRTNSDPQIHYGNIASGNEVLKHGVTRDKIAKDEGVICFEMEAAGLMDNFPSLVIRGICDYADSHKNKVWQPYAAATAAALAKELLSFVDEQEAVDAAFLREYHWTVPFERNKDFVGRESLVKQLIKELYSEANRDCQRIAIVGLGGVGKTQVALETAFRIQDKCSVFWVPAINTTSFEGAYRDIGRKLQLAGIEDDKADVKPLIKSALSQERACRWLLIVDNADDLELLYGAAGESNEEGLSLALVDYLPFNLKGSILFTTRNRKAAVKLAGKHIITVEAMTATESLELLETGLTEELTKDRDSTSRMLELLTNLPLAIKQASAYMNENQISTTKYLEIYQSSDDELIYLLGKDFEDRGRYKNAKNPIATTWLISFRYILKCDSLAADYLRIMSCLVEKDIPYPLLPPATKARKTEAIGTLKAYAFITQRESQNSYDIHRLVQLAARNWLKEQRELNLWAAKTLLRLAEEFPFPEHENRDVWIKYLPHAQHVLEFPKYSVNDEESKRDLLFNVGESFRIVGKYREAEAMHRQALQLKEVVLGKEHPSTLSSMNNLALVLDSQGKYEEAEAMHRQALQLKEVVLGKEHPSTLGSMNNLALVLRSQGKYEEAEAMHRQALQLKEVVLGKEHPSTLSSMNNLALVLRSQGKYEEAEAMHRQALQLREAVLGKEHPSTLGSMNNLALVLGSQGKYEEAEAMHRQEWKLSEAVLGKEHPSTLSSMNNLALVLRSQGKYEEAEAMHRQEWKLREAVLGKEHPSTLGSMNNLALVLRSQGKYEEAEAMHQQALQLSEVVLGKEHPSTLGSMNNLALVLDSQGKYEEAEAMHRQALQLSEVVLGKEHPSTLDSMNNLALVLRSQGKYEEAEAMHQQALQLSEVVLGKEHPSTLNSMNNLALVLRSQGKYEEAEAMHQQALQLSEVVLGKEHPSTLDSMNNLALVLRSQGKYEEAEAMHRQALQLSEVVLGKEHPSTLGSMNNLALVLRSQGKYEEAEAMHQQALQLKEVVLGKEHPSTLDSMNNLALVLRSQGKYEEAEAMHRQALQLREAVLGKEHPSTLGSMNNLALVLDSQGKYEEAGAMHRQALQLKEVVLGKEHPSTLDSMNNKFVNSHWL